MQFRTCISDKPRASPLEQRRENSFIKEKGKLGGAVINEKCTGGKWEFEVVAFHCPARSTCFSLLLEMQGVSPWGSH